MNNRLHTIGCIAIAAALAACGGGTTETATTKVTPPPVVVDSTPASLTASSDTVLSGVVGAALSAQPSVVVKTKTGTPVPNVPVTFEVVSGGGSLSASTVATSTDGSARTTWTLGRVPGAQSIRASAAALPSLTFRATAATAPPSSVAKVSGDAQTVTVGAVLQPLAVRVTDALGNPASGVVLAASVTAGQGTLATSSITTDTSGKATLSGWTAGIHPGANSIEISAQGLTPVSFSAVAAVGPAQTVTFATNDTLFVPRGDTVATFLRASDKFGNDVPATNVVLHAADGAIASASEGRIVGVAIGVTTLTASIASTSVTIPLVVVGHPTGSAVAKRLTTSNLYGYLAAATANGVIFAATLSPPGINRLDASGTFLASFLTIPTVPAYLQPTADAARLVFLPTIANGISMLDLTTGALANMGFTDEPYGLVLSRDGKHAYVSLRATLVDVPLPISSATRSVGMRGFIRAIAKGPADSLIYTIDDVGQATEIEAKTFSPKRQWVMARSHSAALSHDGAYLYSAETSPLLEIARLSDTTVISRVALPTSASSIAVSPDGKEFYVAMSNPSQLQVYRLTDPSNPALDRTITLDGPPENISMDPHGAFLIVNIATSSGIIDIVR